MLSQDAPAAHPAAAMDYPAEIYRLNLTYLIAARDALLNCGQDYAEMAFGLEEPLRSWLVRASGTEIHELAGTRSLLFTLRLPPGRAGARILAGCARGREAALAARMHALQHLLGGADAGAAA